MRRTLVLLLGVVLIGALAILSFAEGGSSSTRDNVSETAFDLPALQGGGRVTLIADRGRPVVVTLFASWCTACRTELPEMAGAAARLRGRVDFIGVDSQETGNGAAFANHYRLAQSGFTLARDVGASSTGGLYHSLGARGLPITAFYSAAGRVEFKANGAMSASELDGFLTQYAGMS
jgi:thiol-disulfide isomerase/thioredoxin